MAKSYSFVFPQQPDRSNLTGMMALSLAFHVLMLVTFSLTSALWNDAPGRKVYIVNLVPAASISSPAGRPALPASRAQERPYPKEAARELAPRVPEERRALTPPPPLKAPEATRALSPPRPSPLELPILRKGQKETPEIRPTTPSSSPPPRIPEQTPERPVTPTPPTSPPPVAMRPEPLRPAMPPAVASLTPTTPLVPPVPLGRSGPLGSGSISLDVSDFPFTWYLVSVQKKVAERWEASRGRWQRQNLKTVIVFEIQRDGQVKVQMGREGVKYPAVESSSGDFLYDQTALRAVLDADPFPELPKEFKEGSLRVHFGFELRERG